MIAIVIPAFRHSVLLFDAIASLLRGDVLECDIVVVDDGCPDPATLFGGLGLSALTPRIHYIRGRNRGLSGARNRGIEYVLAVLPDAEAIFFLDADNMLSPWSHRQMSRVLIEHPEADWFYPDIRMFGLELDCDFSGPYTVLVQSLENICEAGSLVRRRVFESGTRFSDAMRLGFEDWDFWLSAVEAGFRGRHFPASGFRYRKRPESMLADSNRDAAIIRFELEKRHPWMRDMRTMLALEHAEWPRYAIYLRDLHIVRLTSSAEGQTEEIGWPEYVIRFWRAARAPNAFQSGAILIVTTSHDIHMLVEAKLWHWTLSDLELRLRDSNLACATIRATAEGRFGIDAPTSGPDPAAAVAAVSTQLLREIVHDSTDEWIATADTPQPMPRVSRRDIFLPPWAVPSRPGHGALQSLVGICRELRRSEHAGSRHLPGEELRPGIADVSMLHQELRARFGGALLPPALHYQRPEIAFVLPFVDFGGVEKVTIAVAGALRLLGYGVNLVVLNPRDVHLAVAIRRTFDRIIFMDNAEFENWSGPTYRGTNLSRWSVSGDHRGEVNQLSVFDVVIGAHAGDMLGLMGELRRRGVITASHLHLFDRSALGRNVGHPTLAVAFEHALDLIIGCSQRICAEIHAAGVPLTKVTLVPNASTLELAPERARDLCDARRRRGSGHLNVLFLGRIDQQKGVDRLIDLRRRFRRDERVRFRIVGKPIIDDPASADALAASLEDPVYEPRDLLALYVWADVLVVPSLFEGLPLTLLEAMSVGVVPIVTRVGAVEEAVRDGIDGWIVSQDGCVEEMRIRIEQLLDDTPLLHAMSGAAFESMRDRDWNRSVRALDETLRRLLRDRGQSRARWLRALLPRATHALMAGDATSVPLSAASRDRHVTTAPFREIAAADV